MRRGYLGQWGGHGLRKMMEGVSLHPLQQLDGEKKNEKQSVTILSTWTHVISQSGQEQIKLTNSLE